MKERWIIVWIDGNEPPSCVARTAETWQERNKAIEEMLDGEEDTEGQNAWKTFSEEVNFNDMDGLHFDCVAGTLFVTCERHDSTPEATE